MASNNSVTLSRNFNASFEKVFEAWTNPDQLKRWIAPQGYSVIYAKGDIKAGGESHYCIVSNSGLEIWIKKFFKYFIPSAKCIPMNRAASNHIQRLKNFLPVAKCCISKQYSVQITNL